MCPIPIWKVNGQSLRDTYSITLLSDWTKCTWSDICAHGLNITRCIEQYKSQLHTDHWYSFIQWFIHWIVLLLLLSLQHVHCSHVWVRVIHDGSLDLTIYTMKTIQELPFHKHMTIILYHCDLNLSLAHASLECWPPAGQHSLDISLKMWL